MRSRRRRRSLRRSRLSRKAEKKKDEVTVKKEPEDHAKNFSH